MREGLYLLLIATLGFYLARPASAVNAQVYQLDESTDEWILVASAIDGQDLPAYTIMTEPASDSGAGTQSVPITGQVHFVDTAPNPGRLLMTVDPLTPNVLVIDEGGERLFQVGVGEYAAWRYTYRIENVSATTVMYDIQVFDNFGAELDIVGYQDTYDSQIRPEDRGSVHVWSVGGRSKYFFRWEGVALRPGEWAALVIDVALDKNPAGKQSYSSCGLYELNSEGTLRFRTDTKPGWNERKGRTFRVDVPCPPYMKIDLSATQINWFIRKPGDYFTQVLDGRVEASHPVAITFSDFDDLQSHNNNDQVVPVYYALNTEQPQLWIPADDLNGVELVLMTAKSAVHWNMWQRIVVETQQPCTYSNRGVITFTLQNVLDNVQ